MPRHTLEATSPYSFTARSQSSMAPGMSFFTTPPPLNMAMPLAWRDDPVSSSDPSTSSSSSSSDGGLLLSP
eukprot:CAMPEP_0171846224 /NCGR_PEP_ID=MMETSP0992-20121227/17596_1 /TAXON_ID=483369 /ORGANISM="non described non described, Strain CCMP2098" /LENGTH=70 /DNA_ID=CAMNT_0012464487 /DNA_START=652 /DNA_END=864 /DNA_ORIENTATION=+